MAERAVLARERPDGRYSLARSRWGGTDRAVAVVCAGTSPTALPDTSWKHGDCAPDFRSVAADLDYLSTAALYRVGVDGDTTVFLPLWFGLPRRAPSASPRVGALVAVESLPEARALRRWFRTLKGRLTDDGLAGDIPLAAVPLVLYGAVVNCQGRERYVSALPGTAEGFSAGTGPDRP